MNIPEIPTILLIGADGQVGFELRRTLEPLGRLVSSSLCGSWGPRLDLTDARSLETLIREIAPRLIVNAAAYTAVDRSEEEEQLAQQVNGDALGVIGRMAAERSIAVVHYSTDYVFDGAAKDPYLEHAVTNPMGAYGRTKLDGERQLLESGADAVILRTSWVYGVRGQNFLRTMQRLFIERNELKIVDDQIGAPTWSRMIAEATAQMLVQTLPDGFGQRAGIYHLTNAGRTSWHGFAKAIQELLEADCRIQPIPSSEYPTLAKRPMFSVLDNEKLSAAFGLRLPDWHHALKLCLEEQASLARR